MLRLDVLQNQWLIFSLVGGVAIVLAVILLYTALWRPRREETADEGAGPVRGSFMPWLIVLMIGATAFFAAVYAYRAFVRPPNW